jgi:fatty acid desaturase
MRATTHALARRQVSKGRESAISAMHRLDDLRRLGDLALYLGLWLAGAGLSLWSWTHLQGGARLGLAALGWMLSAIALNAHILLVHEGMHSVLFKAPLLNRSMGSLLGWTVLMSSAAYQVQHLRHHAFLGTKGDPDEYNNYAAPGWKLWALHCLRLALGSYLYLLFIPVLSWRKAAPAEKRRMALEYGLLAGLLALLVLKAPFWALCQAWLIPLIFVNFMMNTRGLTQHSLAEPQDAFLASRSIRSGFLVRLCLLDENYHLAHHLYPRVPSYRLHALNELLKDRYPREVAGPGFVWFVFMFFRALWRRDESPIGVVLRQEA